MKKSILIITLMFISFVFGFAFKSIMTKENTEAAPLKRVTGIGGIFFKCKEPAKVREWYQKHLGLNTNEYGTVFSWYQGADSTQHGYTQWGTFKENTKYFLPSNKEFMINYRVVDLESLIVELKKEGVTITDTMERYNYGKFIHIMDIEGNKIELWEPNDIENGKFEGGQTK